ncbi:hypothetical protein K491DRAFT_680400 [Lophiostoma macrostomum CBS 122681]|uniref:Uncharacterized protein n=1 Tax=Lophiostoma macrostomum CBS 122681 TaxID=1314788 RepID=A0A6A6T3B3_9PLEO|nr:hypothetical protein K491DRAFT_680400 [Lophiostoma macrostomum CBS 122681]
MQVLPRRSVPVLLRGIHESQPTIFKTATTEIAPPMASLLATSHSPTTNTQSPDDTEPKDLTSTTPNLTWTLDFSIPNESATYLDRPSPSTSNTAAELSIPREVIAEVVSGSRLVAELQRPIKLGTYNGLPAYLLRTHFAFQRASTSWLYRVQAAEITVEVEDAREGDEEKGGIEGEEMVKGKGVEKETGKEKEKKKQDVGKHPAVAAWHPKVFEGEVTTAMVTESASVGVNAGYAGAGVEVGVEKSRTFLEKGRITAHGVRGGGRNRNSITWVIEQDSVAKSGIPREIRLPLIVTRPGGARFSARVTVKVHYGFWRGALARSVPVVGKNHEPLFFDLQTLREVAERGEKGVDGTRIAEVVGEMEGRLDGVDLGSLSSFQ